MKNYAVVDRDGFFRDVTKVHSAHGTEAAARKAAAGPRYRVNIPGNQKNQSCAMVIRRNGGGFAKGEMVYRDQIRSQYPVVW